MYMVCIYMYAGSHVCWCIHVLVDEICIRNLPVIPPYSLRQSLPRIKTFWIQLPWLASLLCLTCLSAGITGSLLHLSTILPGFCGSKVWFSTLAWACPRFEVFGSTYIVPKWHKIILMPIIEHLKLMFSPLVLHIQMTWKISQEFEDFWGKDVESFWFWVCWCVHFLSHSEWGQTAGRGLIENRRVILVLSESLITSVFCVCIMPFVHELRWFTAEHWQIKCEENSISLRLSSALKLFSESALHMTADAVLFLCAGTSESFI